MIPRTDHVLFPLLATIMLGCGSNAPSSPTTDDTTTTGHVLVLADEDLKPIVEAEAFVFLSEYPEAELDIRYMPEAQLLKGMLNDSVRCVVTTATPGGDQEGFFRSRNINAEAVPICMDAIAVVVNKTCNTERLDLAELKRMLQKEPRAEQEPALRTALIAGSGGGAVRTLVDSLQLDAANMKARAAPDAEALVASLERDSSLCGLIPFAAISDMDNPKMKAFRERVKLLPIARTDTSKAILPTQGTLADGTYPLRREVYMLLTEAKSGLGTGFVSFVANHKGQRIILKSGLAPHKVPAREVEIVHE